MFGWAALIFTATAPAAFAAGSNVTISPPPTTHTTGSATPHLKTPPTSTAKKPAKSHAPGSKEGTKGAGRSHTADPNVRRQIAGGPTAEDVTMGAESAELEALANAERELFPPASPNFGSLWPSELPSPLSASLDLPQVHASGLPPTPVPSDPPAAEGARDLSWMAKLDMPELPVRWEPRVVRFLEFFKNDPRGRAMIAVWMRRAGRYREAVRRTLRSKSIPDDLLWLAMVESGFDPAIRSPAGALGLWQFMPETGRQYGLSVDRWEDDRLDVVAATEAAADFLSDLHRRFGSWDLAIASYNMGYASMALIVRKYNTNDFWALSEIEGSLPWETTLYVPKVLAAAIVGRNPAVFGFDSVSADTPTEFDEVTVPPATSLSSVAAAAGCTTKEVTDLNLAYRAGRTPPTSPDDEAHQTYRVRVPSGKGANATQNLAKGKKDASSLERYVVRFGESLEQIASAHGLSASRVADVNAILPGEVVRGGTVLLLPPPSGKGLVGAMASSTAASASAGGDKPTVIVPADVFVYPDRKRVFYRVVTGDTLRDIASAFQVSTDDIRRWNEVDPVARLQEGMTLQLFVPRDANLSKVVAMNEDDVRTIAVGTDDFFTFWDGQKNRKRITVLAKSGDSLDSIAKKYGLSTASMERINRRPRSDVLNEGDSIIVYLPANSSANAAAIANGPSAPLPDSNLALPDALGPLPQAPAPSALPKSAD
ncbi:MAG: LysM peptidoglycan-binding domain-containing protein [Polyangiaceae bacterium]